MPTGAEAEDCCAICLEPLQTPAKLPCGHRLDSHCLLRLLAREAGRGVAPCPCCRAMFCKADLGVSKALQSAWLRGRPTSQELLIAGAMDEYERARRGNNASHWHGYCIIFTFLVTVVASTFGLVWAVVTLEQEGIFAALAEETRPPSSQEVWTLLSASLPPSATAPHDVEGGVAPSLSRCTRLLNEVRMQKRRAPEADVSVVVAARTIGWLVGGWLGELASEPLMAMLLGSAARSRQGEGMEEEHAVEASRGRRAAGVPHGASRVASRLLGGNGAELVSRCAKAWVEQSVASLQAERAQHAIAHARQALVALDLGDGLGGPQDALDTLRANADLALARALDAVSEPSEATEALARAARAGLAEAQAALALRVEENEPQRAAEWYGRAAPHVAHSDRGVAWRRLGVLLLTGAGSPTNAADYPAAFDAFDQAARSGDADAAFNLGRMYEMRQATRAIHRDELPDAADATVASGARVHVLAAAAATAESAKVQAEAEWRQAAMHWYGVAAERGLMLGTANLARLLAERNQAGDAAAAFVHYRQAARDGDADSAWEVANMLRDGIGCSVDMAAHAHWLQAAADAGHPAALAERQ